MEDRVRAILADVLAIDAALIDQTTSMDTLESWDSLAQIDLVTALEEEFGVTFEVEEFELMTTYVEVINTLSTKLA